MRALISPRAARAARLLNRIGLGGVNQLLKRAVKVATGDKLTIHLDGFIIQAPAVSWRILHELRDGYEALEVCLLKDSLVPGMVVVDVGANIGYYTLTAARIVGENGRVFAFEPDPRTRKALAANVAMNRLDNVTIIEKAASDSETKREMYLSMSANRSSLYRVPSLGRVEQTRQVETTTVDTVLDGLTADVVKMDIEGGEPAALRGMEQSLKPETVLLMEFSPPMLASAGTDPDEFGRLLFDRFTMVELISGGRMLPMASPPDRFTGVGCRTPVNLRCRGWRVSAAE